MNYTIGVKVELMFDIPAKDLPTYLSSRALSSAIEEYLNDNPPKSLEAIESIIGSKIVEIQVFDVVAY